MSTWHVYSKRWWFFSIGISAFWLVLVWVDEFWDEVSKASTFWAVCAELVPTPLVWQAAKVVAITRAQAIRNERLGVDKEVGKDSGMVGSTYIIWQRVSWLRGRWAVKRYKEVCAPTTTVAVGLMSDVVLQPIIDRAIVVNNNAELMFTTLLVYFLSWLDSDDIDNSWI